MTSSEPLKDIKNALGLNEPASNPWDDLAPDGYRLDYRGPIGKPGKSRGTLYVPGRIPSHECKPPGWWSRRRHGIKVHSVWVCGNGNCHQAWQWKSNEWDSGKFWVEIELP